MTEAIVTELVDDRLFAISCAIELDGRVSWAPVQATGYQPVNIYVLIEGRDVMLVDTGVASLGDYYLKALAGLIPHGTPLRVFLTRAAYECVGNLEAIAREFVVTEVLTGGIVNPFDAFDVVDIVGARSDSERSVVRKPLSDHIALSESRPLTILRAPVRMLPTFWLFDSTTGTLFTSDAFAYGGFGTPSAKPVINDKTDTLQDLEIRDYVWSKFWWMQYMRSDKPGRDLDAVMGSRHVERLAPAYGGIITGVGPVLRHTSVLRRLLMPSAP